MLRCTGEEQRRRECKVEDRENQREGKGVVFGDGAGAGAGGREGTGDWVNRGGGRDREVDANDLFVYVVLLFRAGEGFTFPLTGRNCWLWSSLLW